MLTNTHPNDVQTRRQIEKALAVGEIREIVIDEDGNIVANCEVWDYLGDLSTGMRREIMIQPVVLVSKERRYNQPIADVRATVQAMAAQRIDA